MDVRFFTKEMNAPEAKKAKDYSMTKIEAIESLLKHFAEDAKKLQITAEKLGRRSAYRVEFILYLPSKTIIGVEASHEITKAVDLAKDRIVRQLKKHEQLLRSRHDRKKKINPDQFNYADFNIVSELKKPEQDIFTDILQPHLDKLHKFIRRNIYYYETNELVPKCELESDAILNEVILEFYQNYNPQMAGKDLEQWLYTVAATKIRVAVESCNEYDLKKIPVEDETVEVVSKKSVQDEIDVFEEYFEAKDDTFFAEIVSYETTNYSDESVVPEKAMTNKQIFSFVMGELGKMDATKKEAFLLNKMEGLMLAQISEIQHRPINEIKSDIDEVQVHLAGKVKEEFEE